jgi:4-hydroxybutyrate CoA-transferase
MYLNIGIKYCGGCNPKYNRKDFLQKLQKEFTCDFESAKSDKIYDLVLVLCGCTSCCVVHSQLKFKYEKIIVKSNADYIKVKEIINKYSNIQKG